MRRGVYLTVYLVILLTCTLEVSSQQPCGNVQCGYSAFCAYDPRANSVGCSCNFSTVTTPWAIIADDKLLYCKKFCGNGELCPDNTTCTDTRCECSSGHFLSPIGQCLNKCEKCGLGTICNSTVTGDPICQNPCKHNTCSKNATCHFDKYMYVTCPCKPGFTRDSADSCVAKCEMTPCGPNMACNVSAVGGPTCQCRPGYRRNSSEHCIPIPMPPTAGTTRTASVVNTKGTLATIKTTLTEISATNGVTKSTMNQGDGQINIGIIVAAVIASVVAIVVICVNIYAFCRYRKRQNRPTNIPLESNVGCSRAGSVTERPFRGSSSSLDITVSTRIIVKDRDESKANQGYDGSPIRTKVQETSPEYDLETLYGNGEIPENKRLALENKNDHLDNLYSNSSIAENKRRVLEDKTARDVAELSPLDEYAILEDGDGPRYNTLAEIGSANGVVGSKNSSLPASPDCNAEEENDCDYNHLSLRVL